MDPPGLLFGNLLAPKIAENCLEIALGAPKSRSRALWIGPGGLQEHPRRPTGGHSKGTVRATYSQEASKMGPRAIEMDLETIVDRFCDTIWSRRSILGALRAVFCSVFYSAFCSALFPALCSAI